MLTSPRRIAVVILATSIGIAVQTWTDHPDAGLLGFFLGMIIAVFVRAKNGRRIR